VGGAISFDDTLRVLEARGRFMQEACDLQETSMLSIIGLDADSLKNLCTELNLEIANLNSAQQTVVSGTREAIEAAAEKAKGSGAKRAIVLNVAGGYHSSYMQPAADKLKAVLDAVTITTPETPVLSNVTGRPHEGPDAIRDAMLRQISSTVNWLADIEWLQGEGIDTYIECGPGKVLTGLVKRIDRGAGLCNVQDQATLDATVKILSSSGE
jgi:[acyl-carrier-protein] S-malonyltransferase